MDKASDEELVKYINSLENERDIFWVIERGLGSRRRKNVWNDFSPRAKKVYPLDDAEQKKLSVAHSQPPGTLVAEMAKIQGPYKINTAATNGNKKKELLKELLKDKYSDKDRANFINLLSTTEQRYVINVLLGQRRSKNLYPYLTQEAQKSYPYNLATEAATSSSTPQVESGKKRLAEETRERELAPKKPRSQVFMPTNAATSFQQPNPGTTSSSTPLAQASSFAGPASTSSAISPAVPAGRGKQPLVDHQWQTPDQAINSSAISPAVPAGKGKQPLVDHQWQAPDQAMDIDTSMDALAMSLQNSWMPSTQQTQESYSAADINQYIEEFYQDFKQEHSVFSSRIQGISNDKHRDRYALLTLNRLAFLSFLQEKGFLNGDQNYLQTHLKQVQMLEGPAGTSYQQSFLSNLYNGLNQPGHSSGLEQQLGKVPYLNIDLFDQHELESMYPQSQIPNKAFKKFLRFSTKYQWQLDEKVAQGIKVITPETFSRSLEQMANEKYTAAYYTKEDITEYISKNAIIPTFFDELNRRHRNAFLPASPVWSLLSKNFPGTPLAVGAQEHINGIEDLITSNLDSRAFAERFIVSCQEPDILLSCYDCLAALTVLDPTCGTGAFLFATSNILAPLYEACLTQMKVMIDRRGDQIFSPGAPYTVAQEPPEIARFRTILQQVGNVPLRYFIHKTILTKNLYGVDIMPEAIEVCKLCLNLKLLAQVDKPENWSEVGISSVPSGSRLNVLEGNALVGFDWSDRFQPVRNGGFSVIVGNPPYTAYRESDEEFPYTVPEAFETRNCGDIYPCVVEQSQQLLSPQGYMGMIVPLNGFATKKKLPFLTRFYTWFPRSWLSFYHYLPNKLFDGGKGVDMAMAIFLGKPTGQEQRFSTKLMRWDAHERDQLFSSVKYCPVTVAHGTRTPYYPKFGHPIESTIMGKIVNHGYPVVDSYLGAEITDTQGTPPNSMWYRDTGGTNWKVFVSSPWLPKGSNTKKLSFKYGYKNDVFVALFNSSLFWWYCNTSIDNTRHTPSYVVRDFPFLYPANDPKTINALSSLAQHLVNDYRKHARPVTYSGMPTLSIYARKSKKIIDEIDKILGEHYGLTEPELNFIINNDLKYRMGTAFEGEIGPSVSVSPAKRGNQDDLSLVRPQKITKVSTASVPKRRPATTPSASTSAASGQISTPHVPARVPTPDVRWQNTGYGQISIPSAHTPVIMPKTSYPYTSTSFNLYSANNRLIAPEVNNTNYWNNRQISTPHAPIPAPTSDKRPPTSYALPTQPAVSSTLFTRLQPPVTPNVATSSTVRPPLPPAPSSSLTVDARAIQETLRPILGPTGRLAQYIAKYQRGRGLFSPLESTSGMGRALYIHSLVVQMLSDAIDAIYPPKIAVTSIENNLNKRLELVVALDRYLTRNNDLLDNFIENRKVTDNMRSLLRSSANSIEWAYTAIGQYKVIPSKKQIIEDYIVLPASLTFTATHLQAVPTATLSTQPLSTSTRLRPPVTTTSNIRPAPVETLSRSAVKMGPVPRYKPVPFKKIDLTGQLWQNQDHPFVQTLAQTWAGRGALKTEQLYGKDGKLFVTNGTESFYDPHSNTISIGLGETFGISEQFMQKRLIHEQTHRWLAQTGQTADPRHFKQAEDYAKFMLLEEAEAEGNAIDHLRELHPNGPFSASEQIYVQAYREGYDDLKTMMLWATEEQLAAEGRKRGKEALFQAFKHGALAPSTGEYETYAQYYEMQWRAAWKRQVTVGIRPGPMIEGSGYESGEADVEAFVPNPPLGADPIDAPEPIHVARPAPTATVLDNGTVITTTIGEDGTTTVTFQVPVSPQITGYTVEEDGTHILFDSDQITIFKNPDETFTQAIHNPDGSVTLTDIGDDGNIINTLHVPADPEPAPPDITSLTIEEEPYDPSIIDDALGEHDPVTLEVGEDPIRHANGTQTRIINSADVLASTNGMSSRSGGGAHAEEDLLNDLTPILKITPIGQEIVHFLTAHNIAVISGQPGQGTYYHAERKALVIDPQTPFKADIAVANLTTRALTHLSSGESLDPANYDSLEDYIDAEINELASAITNQVRYNQQRNGVTGNYTPTTLEYHFDDLESESESDEESHASHELESGVASHAEERPSLELTYPQLFESKQGEGRAKVIESIRKKEIIAASFGLAYQDLLRIRWDRAHGKTPPALVIIQYPVPEHSEQPLLPPEAVVLQPPAPLSHPAPGVVATVGASTIEPLNAAYADPTHTSPAPMPRLALGADPMPYLEPSLQKTEEGRDTLLIKEVFNIKVVIAKKEDLDDALAQFLYSNSTNKVSLAADGDREEMTEGLVHEMRHAAWTHLQVQANRFVNYRMTEERFVAWEIIEEADTFAIEIEQGLHSGGRAVHFLRDVYSQGYQRGVNAEFKLLKANNAPPTPELLDKAGRAEARKETPGVYSRRNLLPGTVSRVS